MISSFLVDKLNRKAQETSAILAYYFCDNKDEKRDTATAILRGLLLQLLREQPDLSRLIQEGYKIQKESLFNNLDALWMILLDMIKTFAGETYFM
jgi:hypothetical protein